MFGRSKRRVAKLGPRRRTAYEWSTVAFPPPPPADPQPLPVADPHWQTAAAAAPAAEPMPVESVAAVAAATIHAVSDRRTRIRLGFADGSQVEIAEGSPDSMALHRLADVIMGDREAG